ncbi:PepSY domain-containing protein [Pseudoalteromonas byunsanensis]|uniref:Uncharacterized protein n=1 Tax=Pseudoalteromonas byunsanensis TaxID=327939 RepID=A0A1S1N5T3_9GAMM|nr:PepSY domain-containing protein [Pseudoalteromonas byunsanensis]OHU94791.1 hypothetical protein BIW53_12215 [Pseudoalteromonas byunsanensis]
MRLSVCSLLFICLTCTQVLGQTPKSKPISKRQAVELALAECQGRTLKITEQSDDYIVRILRDDGRVVDIRVDKKTGTVKKD